MLKKTENRLNIKPEDLNEFLIKIQETSTNEAAKWLKHPSVSVICLFKDIEKIQNSIFALKCLSESELNEIRKRIRKNKDDYPELHQRMKTNNVHEKLMFTPKETEILCSLLVKNQALVEKIKQNANVDAEIIARIEKYLNLKSIDDPARKAAEIITLATLGFMAGIIPGAVAGVIVGGICILISAAVISSMPYLSLTITPLIMYSLVITFAGLGAGSTAPVIGYRVAECTEKRLGVSLSEIIADTDEARLHHSEMVKTFGFFKENNRNESKDENKSEELSFS